MQINKLSSKAADQRIASVMHQKRREKKTRVEGEEKRRVEGEEGR